MHPRLPAARLLVTWCSSPSISRPLDPDRDDLNPILALISSATDHSELEDARAWYEVLLAVNPTAAPQLLSYCELELSQENQSQVEALFSRAFAKSNSAGPAFPLAYPPLWSESPLSSSRVELRRRR